MAKYAKCRLPVTEEMVEEAGSVRPRPEPKASTKSQLQWRRDVLGGLNNLQWKIVVTFRE